MCKKQLSVNEILQYINSNKPDYIGINIFTQNYDIVKYIVENININCECFIGGQVVKCIYNEFLSWSSNSIINIIIGEGKFIIPAIVTGKCVESPLLVEDNKKICKVEKIPYIFQMTFQI